MHVPPRADRDTSAYRRGQGMQMSMGGALEAGLFVNTFLLLSTPPGTSGATVFALEQDGVSVSFRMSLLSFLGP